MAENTKIEWAHHSWSPWHGCANAVLPSGEAHPGCDHCYAEAMAKRNPGTLGIWGEGGTRVVAANWDKPRRWNDAAGKAGVRYRVFPSICDPFEEFAGSINTSERVDDGLGGKANAVAWWRSDIGVCRAGQTTVDRSRGERLATLNDVRADFFKLIDETPNLDWLLLTKRPQNIHAMWPAYSFHACETGDCPHEYARDCDQNRGYRDNAWLLTSVSDQATADALIPELLQLRDLAPVLGLSIEPLLGPVDLRRYLHTGRCHRRSPGQVLRCGLPAGHHGDHTVLIPTDAPWLGLGGGINWVIVGGESGPGARPCEATWIRSIVRQCAAASVSCFVKQLGAFVVDRNDAGFEAEHEVFADGPNAGEPTDRRAWPSPVDVEFDIHGYREEFQGADVRVRLKDKKGGEPAEWPLDLRVRQMPEVRHG